MPLSLWVARKYASIVKCVPNGQRLLEYHCDDVKGKMSMHLLKTVCFIQRGSLVNLNLRYVHMFLLVNAVFVLLTFSLLQ